jgi:transcriptional regulator with XRE-family HTH domain
MLSLATASAAIQFRRMADETDDVAARERGRALARLRQQHGLTQFEAGDRFGITAQGWQKYEAGKAPSIFRPETLRRLLAALGATQAEFESELDRRGGSAGLHSNVTSLGERIYRLDATPPGYLPVRDRLQAGAWMQSGSSALDVHRPYPAGRDPRFEHADQWLNQVVGETGAQLGVLEGDLVHEVDAQQIGYYAKTGDIVVVERTRFGEQERELSLRKVEATPDAVLLWNAPPPQRADPLTPGVSAHHGVEVQTRIRGLVLALIRRLA